jgi:membrane fusion protein (multidrug efflux system)
MNLLSLEEDRRRKILVVAGPALLALIALTVYLGGGRHVSTNNAYVKNETFTISAEVGGRIESVNIGDNSRVKKGDVLFTLEQAPFVLAVQLAEAALTRAESDIDAMRSGYLQKRAELASAEEKLRFKAGEHARFSKLAKSNVVSGAQFDQITHDRNEASQEANALRNELAGELAKIGGDFDMPLTEHPRYKEARATLDKAKLDLDHTTLRAPSDGIAANVDLSRGEYVNLGLPLFSIVNDRKVWIEANFRETDLTYVRAGQPVAILIDTYGGQVWHGRVASVAPATGAEFTLLPPQNSSGNWVKVVQRIMVRIEFDDYDGAPPLAAGMSCDVTIDTGHSRFGRWLGLNG